MKAKLLGVISVVGTGVAFSAWLALQASAAQEFSVPVREPAVDQFVIGAVYPMPVSIGELLGRAHR